MKIYMGIIVKINKDFMIRDIAGETILVTTGKVSHNFNGVITLNEVASFILKNIEQCNNEEVLVEKFFGKFEIDKDTVKNDTREFLEQLLSIGVIVEG